MSAERKVDKVRCSLSLIWGEPPQGECLALSFPLIKGIHASRSRSRISSQICTAKDGEPQAPRLLFICLHSFYLDLLHMLQNITDITMQKLTEFIKGTERHKLPASEALYSFLAEDLILSQPIGRIPGLFQFLKDIETLFISDHSITPLLESIP